jgi:hypothetical protein
MRYFEEIILLTVKGFNIIAAKSKDGHQKPLIPHYHIPQTFQTRFYKICLIFSD